MEAAEKPRNRGRPCRRIPLLSAPFYNFDYVCGTDRAHAEGVAGGRRRRPAGFSGITRRGGALWSAIGA